MNRQQAIAFLGLDEPFSAAEVRKAYLRSLKKHNPERDPEGFKQLRAAYELLLSSTAIPKARDEVDARGKVATQRDIDENEEIEVRDRSAEDADSAVDGARERASGEPPWEREIPSDPKEAASLARDWIARAERDATAPRPPMRAGLAILLELLHKRAFKTAGPLLRAMDGHIVHAGGGAPVAWALTHGLWSMRKEIDAEIYGPMVQGVAEERPEVAGQAITAYAAADPFMARALLKKLDAQAPELAQAYGALLQRGLETAGPPGSRDWSFQWARHGLGVLVVLVGLSNLVRFIGRESTPPPVPPPAKAPDKPVSAAWELADEAALRGHHELAGHSTLVGEALVRGDCASTQEPLQACSDLVERLQTADQFALRPMLDRLQQRVKTRCPAPGFGP